MAKYNRIEEPMRKAKEYMDLQVTRDRSDANTLRSYNAARISKNLYQEGINWFNSNRKLDEATEKVNIDGKETAKKDIIYFVRGYQAGCRQLGFNFGYKGVNINQVKEEFLNDKYFLDGYKNGISEANKDKKSVRK